MSWKCEKCNTTYKNSVTSCLSCDTKETVSKLYNKSFYFSILLGLATFILLCAGIGNVIESNSKYLSNESQLQLGISLIICSILTCIACVLIPLFLDWAALVLDNLHELNNKNKK